MEDTVSDNTYQYRRGGSTGFQVLLNGTWTDLNPAVANMDWLRSSLPLSAAQTSAPWTSLSGINDPVDPAFTSDFQTLLNQMLPSGATNAQISSAIQNSTFYNRLGSGSNPYAAAYEVANLLGNQQAYDPAAGAAWNSTAVNRSPEGQARANDSGGFLSSIAPILAIGGLALGGAGALGLLGDTAAGAAGAAGAADLAGTGGALGLGTGTAVGGLGTGTAMAGFGAGTAASNAALSSFLTGGLTGGDLAALGGGLTAAGAAGGTGYDSILGSLLSPQSSITSMSPLSAGTGVTGLGTTAGQSLQQQLVNELAFGQGSAINTALFPGASDAAIAAGGALPSIGDVASNGMLGALANQNTISSLFPNSAGDTLNSATGPGMSLSPSQLSNLLKSGLGLLGSGQSGPGGGIVGGGGGASAAGGAGPTIPTVGLLSMNHPAYSNIFGASPTSRYSSPALT